jgi:predicted MFS family arabinose efflux permease
VDAPAKHHESQLWVMAAIAFAVFYSKHMMAPLVPALSHEFSVSPYELGWLIPGFLIPYGVSTLVYGAVSDRWGRTPVLVTLLCFATLTMMLVSFAGSWRTLLIARILFGVGCGGIVTISLAIAESAPVAKAEVHSVRQSAAPDLSNICIRLDAIASRVMSH